MAELEVPDDTDALALARGGEVNPLRPLFTGDVITDVEVPIFGDSPGCVAVLSHPCAMRRGADLAPVLHVAPVSEYQAGRAVWEGHFRVMPLGEVAGFPNAAIRLDQMTLVRSETLDPDRRVFCASRPGVNLLRQRLVHHLTRVIIDTPTFDEEAAPAHEEIDLMEEWLETAAAALVGVADASAHFHEWIREVENGSPRQERLKDPQAVAGIRRAARSAARERYGA